MRHECRSCVMGVDHEFTVNGSPESQVYKVLGFPLQYGKERPLSLARALSLEDPLHLMKPCQLQEHSHAAISGTRSRGLWTASIGAAPMTSPASRSQNLQARRLASNSQCPRPGSATDLNRFNGRYVAGRSSGPQRRNGDSRVRSPWRRHDQAPRRFSGDMDGYTACAMEQQHRILIPAGISHRNGLAASFRPRAFMRNTASSSERSRGSQPLPFRPVGRQPFPLSQALGNVAHPYTQVAALVTRTVLILHHGQQSKRGIPPQACACVGQCVPAAARVVRACACLDQPVCACALYTPCTKDAAHSRTFDARQRRAIVEYTQRWRQRSPLQRLG